MHADMSTYWHVNGMLSHTVKDYDLREPQSLTSDTPATGFHAEYIIFVALVCCQSKSFRH